ncbi:4-hydroxythreonine-4-phosphate dehydrogenase PdxA [Aliikangiella marina]|uniref:4-hydroxythreonine-4-phosphate dehydrogenase n=1 Tax=Aliikangiella marina TaxID=1712262 RepID=A0A545TCA8_9GAMM|nr:4-hydroxythreonine-4-phosphate dehydrogenase PdxA [Aliikangiella marina]TQV74855.1 4-hydroxythreonine-4-phosphate dehydrogenase PdxA [Aliikangiella marina]
MTNNSNQSLPRVLVTMGEPAGIGPELIVKAAQQEFEGQLIACADPELLAQVASKLSLPLRLLPYQLGSDAAPHQPGQIWFVATPLSETVTTGELSVKNAADTLKMLKLANDLALNGQVDAIVTAPVHKANLNQVDSGFLGHTEYFAEAAGIDKVVMMLATNELRVCLQTTHLPLAQVSKAITQDSLTKTISTIIDGLARLGVSAPKIAVCGLNPHAGEGGLLGKEDDEIIQPVIEQFAEIGHQVSGPYPADTLFTPQKRARFDIFLAMYHDQGLPVVKAAGFGQCANITLGLPYIRTSVDHGTALDIANDFSASADSLCYAINYALSLAEGKLPG